MGKDKYRLVRAESSSELERLVNFWLSEGWLCQGGIYYNNGHCYYQAMVIDDDVIWKRMKPKKKV